MVALMGSLISLMTRTAALATTLNGKRNANNEEHYLTRA